MLMVRWSGGEMVRWRAELVFGVAAGYGGDGVCGYGRWRGGDCGGEIRWPRTGDEGGLRCGDEVELEPRGRR